MKRGVHVSRRCSWWWCYHGDDWLCIQAAHQGALQVLAGVQERRRLPVSSPNTALQVSLQAPTALSLCCRLICFQCFDTRRREERPACKYWVMGCWHGYLCGARYTLFAYGPADATAVPEPHHLLCLIDIHTGFIFLVPAHPGCPGKEAVKLV